MKTEREKLLEAALKECADFIEENYRQIHPFTSKAELKRLVADHPWHGEEGYFGGRDDAPNVHGGITYGEGCRGAVCHVPKPGEPDNVWWLGFDCSHYGDLRPGDQGPYVNEHGSYKTANYVRRQTERLAEQAKEAK